MNSGNNVAIETDFLVVGAGLAGLTFARDVAQVGPSVRVVDKGRGIGGRAATKRNGVHVDHGAQYLAAPTDARLCETISEWRDEGWLRVWTPRIPLWQNGQILPHDDRETTTPFYAPPGGMNAIAKRLADGLEDVRTGVTIVRIERDDTQNLWRAIDDANNTHIARRLILNLPPTQLLALAKPFLKSAMASELADVSNGYVPCWAAYYRLNADLPVEWPCLRFADHDVLAWAARDHTKRPPFAPPVLVLHANAPWSRAHLEESPDAVAAALAEAFGQIVGESLPFSGSRGHRWRYAFPTRLFGRPSFWENDTNIGGCGDWGDSGLASNRLHPNGGGTIANAILSGGHLASQVLSSAF